MWTIWWVVLLLLEPASCFCILPPASESFLLILLFLLISLPKICYISAIQDINPNDENDGLGLGDLNDIFNDDPFSNAGAASPTGQLC